MAVHGVDLLVERAFWSLDDLFIPDWDDVESVHPWCGLSSRKGIYQRRVDFRPNSYGDTPYRVIQFTVENGEIVRTTTV